MIRYKFSKKINKEFSTTLRTRINTYFNDNQLSRNGNSQMIGKSVFAIGLYLLPFLLMMTGGITLIPLLFLMWIIMGFGKAFIGMSVMHDALHGSYSKNNSVNMLMGFSAVIVGANPKIWKIQHNVLHHTYTNIEEADEDIMPRFVLRFTPHQPKRWFHKFQHIYFILFYGISTLTWVTIKDFVKVFQYRDKGLINSRNEFRKHLTAIIFQKIGYLSLFLLLPILVLGIPAWITLLMFITMHFVSGLLLTLVFQTAHVMPSSDFILQEDPNINENWAVHQLLTTSNFAMNSKMFSWFLGGLNFQIEHHLFPGICHVHYPNISKIVQQTASEYNLPYHFKKSFAGAVSDHFKLLRQLGKYNTLSTA